MTATFQHVVTIIGGGAAGMTVASLLRKARPDLDIALIEPSDHHFYQPAWTLVGGGAYDVAKTKRPMKDFIPSGVHWIQQRVTAIDPDQRLVTLEDGRTVNYGWLVVAAGIQINWEQIDGLVASLGANGVTSNYRYDLAPYTWECAKGLR
ncbi:MAG: NAD(P)/FAD-dependent oxidoreductase, partial [Algiphilus sp.]